MTHKPQREPFSTIYDVTIALLVGVSVFNHRFNTVNNITDDLLLPLQFWSPFPLLFLFQLLQQVRVIRISLRRLAASESSSQHQHEREKVYLWKYVWKSYSNETRPNKVHSSLSGASLFISASSHEYIRTLDFSDTHWWSQTIANGLFNNFFVLMSLLDYFS